MTKLFLLLFSLTVVVLSFSGCSTPVEDDNSFNTWARRQLNTSSVFAKACQGEQEAMRMFFDKAVQLQTQRVVDSERLTTNKDQLWYILQHAGDEVTAKTLNSYTLKDRHAIAKQLRYESEAIVALYPKTWALLSK